MLLYNSISWIPEAKASSVGARPVVIRDRRDETVDGVIGGCDVDEAVDCPPGCDLAGMGGGFNDARMDCCEKSRREVSM